MRLRPREWLRWRSALTKTAEVFQPAVLAAVLVEGLAVRLGRHPVDELVHEAAERPDVGGRGDGVVDLREVRARVGPTDRLTR